MTTETLAQLAPRCLALRSLNPLHCGDVEVLRLDEFPIGLGAGPTCRIRLTAPGARPLHCLIVSTDRGVAVRRWGGDTRLNGESFTESLLAVGDRITCGQVAFEVVEADDQATGGGVQSNMPARAVPVAWPVSGPPTNSAGGAGIARSASFAEELPSMEQASEVLRLAENCQRLEDELAETHSLLTSLGEELLQARAAAARQATKLTNRIDELEEDLTERDNLLILLQEALEQRTESLATDRDIDSPTGFETESTTNALTSQMTVDQESPEPRSENLGASDQTPASEEPGREELAEETSSPVPDSPDFALTPPEPAASLDWSRVAAEPEANLPAFPSAEGLAPAEAPSLPAPKLPEEDLWDIEKGGADSGSTPLWGEGVSQEALAPVDPNSESLQQPSTNLSKETFETDSGASPAGEDSDHPQPAADPLDSWGEGSLWSTSDSPHASAQSDGSEEDSALLWGQSLPNEGEPRLEASLLPSNGPFPEASQRETHPAVPLDEGSHDAGISALDPNAQNKYPLDEGPAAALPDFEASAAGVDSRPGDDHADCSASDLLEEPLPTPAAPVSFIEKYRHLLEEEGEGATVACDEPAPVVPGAHDPQPIQADGEDDSIEAYMAKMMARLRGDSEGSAASQAPPRPQPVAAPVVESPPPQPKLSPLLNLDDVKTAAVPERGTNMSALRDLANNSARHAIGMANSRRLIRLARTNLLLTAIGVSTGGYLVWAAPSSTSLEMVGGLIGVGAAGLWGCRTLSFLAKARRESRGGHANQAETPASSPNTLLPIDVSSPS